MENIPPLNPECFSFDALSLDPVYTAMGYLLGVMKDGAHRLNDPDEAASYLSLQFEIDSAVSRPEDLLRSDKEHQLGFQPLTPVMLVEAWSPVEFLLKKGYQPITLQQSDPQFSSPICVTSLWAPSAGALLSKISEDGQETDEELFEFIFPQACLKAIEANELVYLVCKPGWSYD